jgi:hypothetical protein
MPNPRRPRPKCLRDGCLCETARPNHKFCSNACQLEHQYRLYVVEWLDGRKSGGKGSVEVSGHVRRYIKETRGEWCEICGWAERNPYTGTIPLHLDHIDGNWANNRPENLRLLCPNHHALTSNYGSRNRGNGRPFVVYKKAS